MIGNLTDMQKRYIWLAGSFPQRNVAQGRGRRSKELLYALHGEDELVIFGYSNPPEWLAHRGLFRALQARNHYTLTDEGEKVFRELLVGQFGLRANVRETRVRDAD